MAWRLRVRTVVVSLPNRHEETEMTRFIVALALVLTLGLAASAAASPDPQTAPGDPLDPRTYAPDSKPSLEVYAAGVQKYTCQPNGTWLFTDPEATLYDEKGKAVGTHFLNFATGRPVWQLKDGSSVEAARKASASGGAGNIAWLLLEGVASSSGSDGDRLNGATWVQRLNTSGGVAPAGTCLLGDTIAVPYSTDYVFWKAV
jgi:Protein of unknown function (DUF3455)